jgi:hypothetical protein
MYPHFRLMFLFGCAALLLCVSLRGDAAPAPQRLAVAVTTPNIAALTWVDQADGSSTLDFNQALAIEDVFRTTTWEFFDNDQIFVSHPQNGKLETFLRFDDLSVPDHSYFFFHERTKDGTGLDGYVLRSADDPTKGFAYFDVQMTGDQGTSSSTFVAIDLTFAAAAKP